LEEEMEQRGIGNDGERGRVGEGKGKGRGRGDEARRGMGEGV